MKHSIQYKILFWLIAIIGATGALLGIFIANRVEDILFQHETNALHSKNIQVTKQVELALDSTTLFTKMVASQKRVGDYLLQPTDVRKKDIVSLFDEYQKENFSYLSIYLMDTKGLVHISTDRSFIGNNYGFRPYFAEALKGNPYVDVALGATTKKLGYYFSYPVRDSNKVIGVIAVKVDPSTVYKSIKSASPSDNETIMITNLHGVILFSTKIERELSTLGPLSPSYQSELKKANPFKGAALKPLQYEKPQKIVDSYSQPSTIEMMDGKDNERELISIARVKNYPFYFVTETGLDSLISDIIDIARILGIGIFGSAILALTIVSIIIRKMLSPLDMLKKHADHLRRGDFSKKIDLHTGDELEDLGNSFNLMQDDLQKLYSGLEKKVDEKVQELQIQLKETDRTKQAMLNLLEDINLQKAEIETHAIELQKFQLAVENAHDHIVITDPEGIILYANKAVEKTTGFSNDEIFSKKAGCKALWGGRMDKKTYEVFWKCIKIDKKVFLGEFNNVKKDGQKYIAEAQVSPICDENGNVRFFVGIERDITKIKEVDRMKTEFISLASHQLRTPLSAMKWFLEMLLNGDAGKLNDEQKEFITNVDQSNNRMIELVNSLLNVSRIESGRIIIEPQPTNIKELITETLNEVKVQYKDKKQVVIINVHDSLPLIPLDQKLMRQVYLNLFTNAMKYSPPQSEILIFVSKENDMIISQVTDNGYGIPKKEQDHIFSKFYRATNAIKKETEGNGLGLYLVQSIIESSGGKIWFTSEEAKGTSFYFSIPLSGMKQKAGEVHMS